MVGGTLGAASHLKRSLKRSLLSRSAVRVFCIRLLKLAILADVQVASKETNTRDQPIDHAGIKIQRAHSIQVGSQLRTLRSGDRGVWMYWRSLTAIAGNCLVSMLLIL